MGLLAVKSRVVGKVVVIEPKGDLDISTVEMLRQTFTSAFADGYTDLVVVLDGLDFMDSSGLGTLVGGFKRARAQHGSLELVCTKPFFLQAFAVTGLNKVMNVHESLEGLVEPPTADRVGRRRPFGSRRSN